MQTDVRKKEAHLTFILQVQRAIHAPHINWETCSSGSVYVNAQGQPGRDQSVASTLSVLPNVIEKSLRTVVVHGLAVRFNFHRQLCTHLQLSNLAFRISSWWPKEHELRFSM